MLSSRIDSIEFRGGKFYVKRDDLLDNCLSGNKLRKLYTLTQTPQDHYHKIISYGGAQSNAMYALSCLCKQKGWEFEYYTKTLPQYLKDGAEGNLELSIDNGMKLCEVEHSDFNAKVQALQEISQEKTLVLSQGGADELAKEGVALLAKEINTWKQEEGVKNLTVVLPSGTGTTALYLKAFLDADTEIYTAVLVGDEAYQLQQWKRLSDGPYPKIFKQHDKKKFAKPYDEYLQIYKELKEKTGITFDLIYAPRTWLQLLENLNPNATTILYIHTGGISGNETMLQRYAHQQKGRR